MAKMTTLVYSNEKIDGLEGRYINPQYFSGMPMRDAKIVYTDDEKVKTAYANTQAQVKAFPKKREKATPLTKTSNEKKGA